MSKKQVKVDLPKEQQKVERTVQEIQNEYTSLAARAGQLQYQVFTLDKDLQLINSKMRDLNFEAAAVQAKQQKSVQETTTNV